MSEHKNIIDATDSGKKSLLVRLRPHSREFIIGIIAAIVLVILSVFTYNVIVNITTPPSTKAVQATKSMNNALQSHNTSQALADAKKALANEPNNFNDILAVAYLTQSTNPNEAKQYFKQALDLSNQQDNANVPGKSAITYWGAANLAQQAGETDQAKIYYEEVIKAADPSNSYQQSLAIQSQAQLRKLQ